MVGAGEGDDPGPAGNEERGSQSDLDSVLTGHAEHHLVAPLAEPESELRRDVRFGEVTESVHAALGLGGDRRPDVRITVSKGRDTKAAREIEVLAAVRVDDPAALGLRPDHGFNRLSVSSAI